MITKVKWFFQSRKVMIAISTILVEIGNKFFGWNIPQETMDNIVTLAISVIAGVAFEDAIKTFINNVLTKPNSNGVNK